MKWWILWAALFVVGVVFVGYFCALRFFFRFALDATKKTRIGKPGDGTKYESVVDKGILWLHSHDTHPVSIKSFDGLTLRGHYYPAENAKRLVLFFHGWRGGWAQDFSPFLAWFYANDCAVLLVEQRGQGSSDGRYMTMGMREWRDVHSWLAGLEQLQIPEALPVYLMGVSMGAASVLLSAGEPYPREVRGIIADCGFTGAYEMFREYGWRAFHIPEYPLLWHLNRRCQKKVGVSLKERTVPDALAACETPVLFVHGLADDFVLPHMSEENYRSCASEKELVLIPNAGHCMSFLVGQEAYTQALKRFFAAHDGSLVNQ